jgi:hypothetical protein
MTTIDLTGKKFGRLTVEGVERGLKRDTFRWLCRCVCGATRMCRTGDLKAGRARDCFDCADVRRAARLRRAANRRKQLKSRDVGELTASLDADGLRRYERWEASCTKLRVKVSRVERVEVLREIVNTRAV